MKTQQEVLGHGKPVVLQVVGYQNSGKTSLMKKLIAKLTMDNWKVATIKHHGHGGKPDFPNGKDSNRHLAAGAVATIVEGGGSLLLHCEQLQHTLEEQIQLLSFLKPDFILIEGHKHEDYPKVILMRNRQDEPLLHRLTNIVAVFYWQKSDVDLENIVGIPHFRIDHQEGYSWLQDFLITVRNR